MKKTRTPWIDARLQVAFEQAEMRVLHAGSASMKKVRTVRIVFRLPDGTEFVGHRLDRKLREKITETAKPKGIRK